MKARTLFSLLSLLLLTAATLAAQTEMARPMSATTKTALATAALAGPAGVTITLRDGSKKLVTPADLQAMPRETIDVVNMHTKQTNRYTGVLLSHLLTQAGALGKHAMAGVELRYYYVACAADGYRVTFSLGEVDPDTHANQILVADTQDGQPLPAKFGPLMLVVPGDKNNERSVRMLAAIEAHSAD